MNWIHYKRVLTLFMKWKCNQKCNMLLMTINDYLLMEPLNKLNSFKMFKFIKETLM